MVPELLSSGPQLLSTGCRNIWPADTLSLSSIQLNWAQFSLPSEADQSNLCLPEPCHTAVRVAASQHSWVQCLGSRLTSWIMESFPPACHRLPPPLFSRRNSPSRLTATKTNWRLLCSTTNLWKPGPVLLNSHTNGGFAIYLSVKVVSSGLTNLGQENHLWHLWTNVVWWLVRLSLIRLSQTLTILEVDQRSNGGYTWNGNLL